MWSSDEVLLNTEWSLTSLPQCFILNPDRHLVPFPFALPTAELKEMPSKLPFLSAHRVIVCQQQADLARSALILQEHTRAYSRRSKFNSGITLQPLVTIKKVQHSPFTLTAPSRYRPFNSLANNQQYWWDCYIMVYYHYCITAVLY